MDRFVSGENGAHFSDFAHKLKKCLLATEIHGRARNVVLFVLFDVRQVVTLGPGRRHFNVSALCDSWGICMRGSVCRDPSTWEISAVWGRIWKQWVTARSFRIQILRADGPPVFGIRIAAGICDSYLISNETFTYLFRPSSLRASTCDLYLPR